MPFRLNRFSRLSRGVARTLGHLYATLLCSGSDIARKGALSRLPLSLCGYVHCSKHRGTICIPKNGWLVPVCMALVTLITQPLAGVDWLSVRENEGPIIVIIVLPACAVCFFLGYCVRVAALSARRDVEPGTHN